MAIALVYVSLGIILVAFLVQRLFKWRKRSLLYSKLPGPKHQHLLLGDLPLLVGRSNGMNFHIALLQSLLGLARIFRKDGFFRLWMANDPYVVLFSAEAMEPILSSQALIPKGRIYDSLKPWLKQGLLTSEGNKWRVRRKLLTPTFHYRILDEFVPIFDQHAKEFVKKLATFSEEEAFDIVPLASSFTLGVVCETAMGIKTNTNPKEFSEYIEAITGFGDILMTRLAKAWLQNEFIFSFSSYYSKHRKLLNVLHKFSRKVVKERKKELIERSVKGDLQEFKEGSVDNYGIRRKQALLDLLLQCQLRDGSLSDEDICEEVDTFMFAGHDTTSAGIYWTLYHLGRNPEIQEKAYQELQELLGDDKEREVTLTDVNEMKYLDRVIKESQRVTPPVPMVSRRASEDLNIKGYSIPRGTSMLMLILALHHDPDVFPNPELFDPDRFLIENSATRHPFSFVPFSAGSRNCIGQRFAMLEMKVALSNIIRNFVLEVVDPPDNIPLTALMILKPVGGLKIRVKKRC